MKKIKQIVASLLIAFMIAPNGKEELTLAAEIGTTITAGQITTDTIWTKEGSPYKVTGGFGLADGVKLTIEKGVKVEFAKNTGLSAYLGQLIVNGTEAENVIFQFEPSVNSLALYNERIDLGSNSQLKNVEIHGARIGLDINGQNNLIENALIMDSDFYGIDVTGKNNHIKTSILKNNKNGVTLFGGENTLTGNTIDSSSESGVIIEQNSTRNIFINNTITKSGAYGLHSEAPYDSIISRFYHNTFKENHFGLLTGTANTFHQNNILDSFTILNSTLWNMDLTSNYWGTTDCNEILGKIKTPGTHYLIQIDPNLTTATGLFEKIEAESPVFNPVKDNDEFITGHANPGDNVTITQKTLDWTSVKEVIADENGLFKAVFSKVPVGEKIEAYTTTPYGIKSPIVFTNVTDGTKPLPPIVEDLVTVGLPSPTIEDYNDSMTLLKGMTEANSTVWIYVDNQFKGGITSDSTGNIEFLLGKQKAGSVIKLMVFKNGYTAEAEELIDDVTAPFAPQVGQLTEKSTRIVGIAERFSTISIKTSGHELATGVVNNAQEFYIEIPVQKVGTVLEIQATDSKGNTSEVTRIVVQDTAPATPEVNVVTNKATQLTGQAEPNVTIIATIAGTKYIGKAGTNGLFKFMIPIQNAGTIISVVAKESPASVSVPANLQVIKIGPNMPTVNTISNKTTYVSGKTEAYATVSVIMVGKTYTTKADPKGIYKLTIPVQSAGVRVLIVAKDNQKINSATRVTNIVRVAPNMPSVNTVRTYSTAITGKTEPFTSVVVKIDSKIYTSKSDKYGNYKVTILKQRKGTKIYVYAKDSKGISAIKTLSVL